ncbi:MAG TPA: tyrosine-type recombinase/integrase [Ktedonobacteraceae bacterium]
MQNTSELGGARKQRAHGIRVIKHPFLSSPYVFLSQRSDRLTDAGLHHWFRALKQQATPEEQALIADISFHDLRDDFAHRALSAGWTLEEVAYYLGHVTKSGTSALQTTLRYTQMTRAQVKEKLHTLRG